MTQFIIAILAMGLNLAVLFFVVRYATRSSEQVELLRQILANAKPEVKSEIVKLTEERAKRSLAPQNSTVCLQGCHIRGGYIRNNKGA